MTLVLTVVEVIAPVCVLAALGYGWVRAGRDFPVPFVTQLAMTLALPCLIFDVLARTELAPDALGEVALAAALAYGAVTLLFGAIVWFTGLDRRTYLAPLIFANTGNLGLPLALFAYGEQGLGFAIVIFAMMALGQFTFGIWLMAGEGTGLRTLREPIVIATLAGSLFVWQGWALPAWLGSAVELVGQLAIPLMVLTLGVAVARLAPGGLGRALWLSLLKAALSAAVALGVASALALDPVARAVLVLQLITPVAVTSYLLAQRYRADAEAVAGLVVVSTALAIVILPLALVLLGPP